MSLFNILLVIRQILFSMNCIVFVPVEGVPVPILPFSFGLKFESGSKTSREIRVCLRRVPVDLYD